MRYRKVFACALAILCLLGFASKVFARSEGLNVGIVDVQKILLESQAGKIARDLLQKTQERIRKELDEKRKELEDLQKSYDAKQEVLSDKARREMEQKILQKQEEFQRLQLKAQMDLQSRDAEFTRSILDELKPLIQQIAKERGLDLILEKNEAGVLYHRESLDLTDLLLKRYDEMKSKK
jgi:outer membrane protein